MGAWGYGIRQDDFVLDVIGDFEDLLKAGKSIRDASEARPKFGLANANVRLHRSVSGLSASVTSEAHSDAR